MIQAHPARLTTVSGTLKHYYKHTNYGIETGRDIVLNEQPSTYYQLTGSFSPSLPTHLIFNYPVTLTVDQGSHDAVAVQALDPANPQAGESTFRSAYYEHPEQLASDRLWQGGGLVLLGALVLAVFGYFRFFYTAPSAEAMTQAVSRGAAGDYGPRSSDVAEYLRTLAAMPAHDWQRVGEICLSARMSGVDAVARHAAANLDRVIHASGRRHAASRAYAAAEKIIRAHPRVADQTGLDVRNFMVMPLATIAAAMTAVDVLAPDDFRVLYQPMAWVVPYDPVRQVPPSAPEYLARTELAQTA